MTQGNKESWPTPVTAIPFQAGRVRRIGIEPGVRDVRIVHELDGLRDIVRPSDLSRVGNELWQLVADGLGDRRPSLILGLDAGGILPAVAVSQASGIPFRLAWKLDLDLPDKKVFYEVHARRTEVFVYGDLTDETVLIVDDEVTSGATVISLVQLLQDAGATVLGTAVLVEDLDGQARSRFAELGTPLWTLLVI